MKLNVLSALLMSAGVSAFAMSCDERAKNRTDTVEPYGERPVTPTPEQRAEAADEAREANKDIKVDQADSKMDLTKRVSEIEKEWNTVQAKAEARTDLTPDYRTLSQDIENQLKNAKAQIEQIDQGINPQNDEVEKQLDQSLDDLEKRIDQAEDHLG
jgi:archaellum component FlaC